VIGISLRQLEAFVAAARRGNVTRAAQDLCLSQPAASQALADLETQLGEKLFDRRGRRLHLNASGRALLPLAADVLDRARDLRERFRAGGALSGELRVGASSTVGSYLLPVLMGRFVAAHPSLRATLEVANSAAIVQALLRYEIDVGFSEGGCRHEDVEALPWRADALVVVASADHPLALRSRVALRALEGEAWILRERGSGTRDTFEQALAGRLPAPRVLLELGHTEAVKQAVAAGLGLGCLSRLAVERELRRGELKALPVADLPLARQLSILIHRRRHRSRALKELLRVACE
jgi:DNA-binding transcriptional LysR family regulator